MIGVIFASIIAVIVLLGGTAAWFKVQAAQVPALRGALTSAHVAIDEQGKAIRALDELRTVSDRLYAEATAERAEGVRVITVYREKQLEAAKTDAALAEWGATRVPDAVLNRLREHDARYSNTAGSGQSAGQHDGGNTRSDRAEDGRKQ